MNSIEARLATARLYRYKIGTPVGYGPAPTDPHSNRPGHGAVQDARLRGARRASLMPRSLNAAAPRKVPSRSSRSRLILTSRWRERWNGGTLPRQGRRAAACCRPHSGRRPAQFGRTEADIPGCLPRAACRLVQPKLTLPPRVRAGIAKHACWRSGAYGKIRQTGALSACADRRRRLCNSKKISA